MHSAGIVIAFKVLKERTPKLRFSQDRFVNLEFPLERAEERFGTGVIPAVPFPTHALCYISALRKGLPCFRTAILDSAIGMNKEIRENSSMMKRVFPSLCDQRCLHVIFDGPSNNPATEEIDEDAKIHPTVNCPDVRDIANPDFAGSRYRKLPVQQILGDNKAMLRVGCQDKFSFRSY